MRRGKATQGSLAGITVVPIDVFAEIASYLHPLDILSLARTTKYFRKLIMQPSAKHIWHAAGRNVPGLPECPPHLSEPAYAALIFQKTCSICGTTVPRNPDPWLYIRLCPHCINQNIVGHWLVPNIVQPYISSSTLLKRQNGAYSLRNDVNFVTDKLIELAGSGDPIATEKWKSERRENIYNRRTFSLKFKTFLHETLMRREDELDELTQQRVNAIQARLVQHGWEAVDYNITHLPLVRPWEKLVEVAKPLTDRTWTNLYPKLEPILTANRQHRRDQERQQRLAIRLGMVGQFLRNARGDECPYIQLALDSEIAGVSAAGERLKLPAPSVESMKELSFVHETSSGFKDLTAEETSTKLEDWRPKFNDIVSGWRHELERELVGIASQDDANVFLMPGRKRLRDKTKRWIHSTRTIVPTSTTFTAESNGYIGDNTKRLLRADSVFQMSGSSSLYFYPEIVYELERKLDSDSNIPRYAKRPIDYDYDDESERLKQPNISPLTLHQHAREIAEELLRRLGRPNAAYLEIKSLGGRFVCERCWNKRPMDWAEMINHYEMEYRLCKAHTNFYNSQELQITHHNLHDLGDEVEDDNDGARHSQEQLGDKDIIDRPTIRILSEEEAASNLWPPLPPLLGCRFCEKIPAGFDKRDCVPRGPKEAIEQHLREVHAGTRADLLESACYEINEESS